MSEEQKEIILYLEHAYVGAKALHDEETMLRISRALLAFKADPYKDVFSEEFTEESLIIR